MGLAGLMGVPGMGRLGWIADHKAPDGVWVDSSGVAFDGSNHDAGLLSVPGQVTGAFGLTPAQALQLGLQAGGVVKAPPAPPPPPASSIGLGTGLVLGGLALGLVFLATRKKSPAVAAA